VSALCVEGFGGRERGAQQRPQQRRRLQGSRATGTRRPLQLALFNVCK
jgi:hypothetical protein